MIEEEITLTPSELSRLVITIRWEEGSAQDGEPDGSWDPVFQSGILTLLDTNEEPLYVFPVYNLPGDLDVLVEERAREVGNPPDFY